MGLRSELRVNREVQGREELSSREDSMCRVKCNKNVIKCKDCKFTVKSGGKLIII